MYDKIHYKLKKKKKKQVINIIFKVIYIKKGVLALIIVRELL